MKENTNDTERPVVLGIDVGSVSTNVVALDRDLKPIDTVYLRTAGNPVRALQEGLKRIQSSLSPTARVAAVGTTGSGRQLAGVMVGADAIKNEITAHAVAALNELPGVNTVLEIGGQDSKIIILRDGIVVDFAMNSVCAAGTGSFLDRQAARLGIAIEEFGELALRSENPVRIAGRCAVFAESDMIHKQQMGHGPEDITRGLCKALVRNYLNNVGKGKEIRPPVAFQGGVAANVGIRKAFEESLGIEVMVAKHFKVMGALGAALIAHSEVGSGSTAFRGFGVSDVEVATRSLDCDHCPNRCEIIQIYIDNDLIARWGGRCPRWELTTEGNQTAVIRSNERETAASS